MTNVHIQPPICTDRALELSWKDSNIRYLDHLGNSDIAIYLAFVLARNDARDGGVTARKALTASATVALFACVTSVYIMDWRGNTSNSDLAITAITIFAVVGLAAVAGSVMGDRGFRRQGPEQIAEAQRRAREWTPTPEP